MQQELKILKQGKSVYLAYPNTGREQECCMEGNLGHCWLACNGYHCTLNCKEEHYATICNSLIGTPIDRIIDITPNKSVMSVTFDELYNIIKNTRTLDALSYEEQESLMYMLSECKKNPEKHIIDNRLVYSKTFAVRLYYFLDKLQGDENILIVVKDFAKCLFAYQIATATDEEELKYIKNLNFPYTLVSY